MEQTTKRFVCINMVETIEPVAGLLQLAGINLKLDLIETAINTGKDI